MIIGIPDPQLLDWIAEVLEYAADSRTNKGRRFDESYGEGL